MDNQDQTPNPHELLDRVNAFEQLTQAKEARDLFSEISELLEHDGQDAMAEFVLYISMCYDDINGQDHRNLDDYTRIALGYFRWQYHNIIPTPEETEGAARCALTVPTEDWTFRISSGVSKGIYKSVVQSDWEFLRIGVAGGQ